ncbi:MAG: GNAT family N-acetyltransferase [Pseudomonadota bacterium]
MTSLTAAYDPAWDALFGEFQLIPDLKPRPGQNLARSHRRQAQRASAPSGAAGTIANALLTNQAVVKVVRGGSVTASGRLGGQLSYITRKGTVEMERGDTGELTHGMDGLRDVQDAWAKDWAQMDARVTSYTYHVILSYPKDTDREAAKQAARSFGERLTNGEYGDRYKYVMAHHDDTGHPHTHLVISRAGALGKTLQLSRYAREMAHFAAINPLTCADERDLEALVSARGHEVTFMQASPLTVPAGMVCTSWSRGAQMVMQGAMTNVPKVALTGLTPLDVPEMKRLVALTEPGPFEAQTIRFGSYWGVRRKGQLVAMAGQRMHFDGYCEISAVCVHPDHRGQGFAQALVAQVAAGIRARNETPFLHTYADNTPAIALYTRLGFRLNQQMHIVCMDVEKLDVGLNQEGQSHAGHSM